MDEKIEVIRCEIPLHRYEEQVTQLIKALLVVDEKLFPEESQKSSKLREVQ